MPGGHRRAPGVGRRGWVLSAGGVGRPGLTGGWSPVLEKQHQQHGGSSDPYK